MFDQILVPVDGSLLAEHILPHTVALAQAYGSQVRLISVMDPGLRSAGSQSVDPWDWQIQRAEVKAYLNSLSAGLQKSGLPVETILLAGKAPEQVLYQATSQGTNLIMLSSHGQGGVSDWNVSSVVMKIVQQARTSVMVIRSNSPIEQGLTNLRYRRILVPVDGSQRAEYGLRTAAHLARAHGAELLITHVIKPPELPHRMPQSKQDRNLIRQVVERNRAEASHYLNNLKDTLDCRVETRLLVDHEVAEALYELVEQEGVDLIALNAHGFSGNPRRPYGNVAANFLAYCSVPLLIIQDFAPEHLVHTREETHTQTFLSRPSPISEGLPRVAREISR